ncbi:MAG: 3-oxoacyl-ACP synthase [Lewinellaceae bacterium]|nr:3-oxoacyl-ACP synthase [Lewinellaceae bacterium]
MDKEKWATAKAKLYEHCLAQATQRIATARAALEAAQEAGNTETKSSAGDKYETGRAMMQQEQEKNQVQLIKAIELKNQLAQLRPGQRSETAGPGSLVITNHGNFYLSEGLGKINLEGSIYFAVSLLSPIGQLLRGKRGGEAFFFQGKNYGVVDVV